MLNWRGDHLCCRFYLDAKPLSEPKDDWGPFLHLSLQQLGRFLPVEEDGVGLEKVEDGFNNFALINLAGIINDGVAQSWIGIS